MVLYVMRWSIHPDKLENYSEWATSAIPRTLQGGNVVEFRTYRPVTGNGQVVATYEFASLEDWSKWISSESSQQVTHELFSLATNVDRELWGPSPLAPDPIRP